MMYETETHVTGANVPSEHAAVELAASLAGSNGAWRGVINTWKPAAANVADMRVGHRAHHARMLAREGCTAPNEHGAVVSLAVTLRAGTVNDEGSEAQNQP